MRALFLILSLLTMSGLFAQEICPHCGMKNCTMGCTDSVTSAQGEKVMVMQGIPEWLFFSAVAFILIISFFLGELFSHRRKNKSTAFRYNLLRGPIYSLFRLPFWRFIFQGAIISIFCLVVYAGLFGHQVINITCSITWTIWWGLLIFAILFFGKAWCFICPWELTASLMQKLKPFGVSKSPLTLGLKFPKFMRNIYPATMLFIFLTWLELGYKVTSSPRDTALLGLLMVAFLGFSALLFEKRSFCRYACLVGRISGLYANFSPLEVRSKDLSVCANCKSISCYRGNEKGDPCPTSLTLKTLERNTYCIMCMECVKSCEHKNVALNVRPFASDLFAMKKFRKDEAYLAVILLALTAFHGLTMTPLWESHRAQDWSMVKAIGAFFGVDRLAAFTIGMSAIIILPILLFYFLSWITRTLAKLADASENLSTREIFIAFAYALLPIALFYHLAHNGMHVFMEGQNIATLISDPLGRGANYFGTAHKSYGPLLSYKTIWALQVFLVLIGHVYSILITRNIAEKIFKSKKAITITQIPLLFSMVLYSCVSLWIMSLDMNMRGSMM